VTFEADEALALITLDNGDVLRRQLARGSIEAEM
jgi:hypothetical protein